MLKNRALIRLFLMICIYAAIVAAVIFIHRISEYKKARNTYVMLQDNVYQNGIINWDKLKNTETVAWLKFKDKPVKINYPVTQHDDNFYYLTRAYDRKKSISGAIFMDSDNRPDLMDTNTVIYGHNMRDGSMFHDLRYFMDQNFWKQNRFFYLYRPDGTRHTYEIFSVNQTYSNGFAYEKNYESAEEFMDSINRLYQSNMIKSDIKIGPDDKTVTLSTCMTNDQNSSDRLIVVGVERAVEQIQAPASWYTAPADNISSVNASGDASGNASGDTPAD